MKKMLVILMALCLMLTLVVCVSAAERDCATDGHDFARATCVLPKTCQACGATEGAPAGHKWNAATCDTPATCKICAATSGEARGHVLLPATCEEPVRCTQCDYTEGKATGHVYTDNCDVVCNVCDATRRVTHHVDENADLACDYCAASLDPGALQGPTVKHVGYGGVSGLGIAAIVVGVLVGFFVWFFAFRKRILGKAGLL